MEQEKKTPMSVPLAIIVAGALIAGAVYLSNGKTSGNLAAVNQGNQNTSNTEVKGGDVTINPISSKDYIRGNPDAKIVLVEFSDPECPFCKVFQGTMKTLIDKYGKDGTLAWVYRNFPIKELHSKAPKEAEALLCAGKIGGSNAFWDFTDRVYATTNSNNSLDPAKLPQIAQDLGLDVTQFNNCLSSGEMAATVEIDHQDALKAGGAGTPFSVLVVNRGFDRKTVQTYLDQQVLQYGFPADLLTISNDNKRVSVSGAMPPEFMEGLISLLAK